MRGGCNVISCLYELTPVRQVSRTSTEREDEWRPEASSTHLAFGRPRRPCASSRRTPTHFYLYLSGASLHRHSREKNHTAFDLCQQRSMPNALGDTRILTRVNEKPCTGAGCISLLYIIFFVCEFVCAQMEIKWSGGRGLSLAATKWNESNQPQQRVFNQHRAYGFW